MPNMRLNLEYHERIEMCTADNRYMHVKCTKLLDGVPSVELLPRLRYQLRIHPSPISSFQFSSLFFTQGLLLVPQENPDGFVYNVVAMNLADKIVRVHADMEIGSNHFGSQSPDRSQNSSNGGSPERIPMSRGHHNVAGSSTDISPGATGQRNVGEDTVIHIESYPTLQSPRSEKSTYHLENAPSHF